MLDVSLGLHALGARSARLREVAEEARVDPAEAEEAPGREVADADDERLDGPLRRGQLQLVAGLHDARVARIGAEERDAHAVVGRHAVGDEDEHLLAPRLQRRRRRVRLELAVAAYQRRVRRRPVLRHPGEALAERGLVRLVDHGDGHVGARRIRSAARRRVARIGEDDEPRADAGVPRDSIWAKIDWSAGTTAVHLLSWLMLPDPSRTKSR